MANSATYVLVGAMILALGLRLIKPARKITVVRLWTGIALTVLGVLIIVFVASSVSHIPHA